MRSLSTNLLTFCTWNNKPCPPFPNNELGGPCTLDVTSSCLLNNFSSMNAPSPLHYQRFSLHGIISISNDACFPLWSSLSFRYYLISLLSSESPVTTIVSNPVINFYSSSHLSAGFDACDHCFLLELFLPWLLDNTLSLSPFIPWLLSLSLCDGSSSSCKLINIVMSQGLVLGPLLYLPLLQ